MRKILESACREIERVHTWFRFDAYFVVGDAFQYGTNMRQIFFDNLKDVYWSIKNKIHKKGFLYLDETQVIFLVVISAFAVFENTSKIRPCLCCIGKVKSVGFLDAEIYTKLGKRNSASSR
jgi:hypothetical protein